MNTLQSGPIDSVKAMRACIACSSLAFPPRHPDVRTLAIRRSESRSTFCREMARSSPEGKPDAIARRDACNATSKSWRDVLDTAKPDQVMNDQGASKRCADKNSHASRVIPMLHDAHKRSDAGDGAEHRGNLHPAPVDPARTDSSVETDGQEAGLQEPTRQLDLNVRAAEFSPAMGALGGHQGNSSFPNAMQSIRPEGMDPELRSMALGPAGMNGQMPNNIPYEMMRYYAQMYGSPPFLAGSGSAPLHQLNTQESQQYGAAGASGPATDTGIGATPTTAIHRASHPSNYLMQAAQNGGHGGMMPYFNGGMHAMPVISPYGPSAHNIYGPQGSYLGNMQVLCHDVARACMFVCCKRSFILESTTVDNIVVHDVAAH
jgi:hypothetical protein